MKAGYLWLSSFACLPLAGWPLLAHPGYRTLSLAARTGLAFAAGAALLSGWMTALALVGLPWQPAVLVALAGATAFALRLSLSNERTALETPPFEGPAGLLEKSAVFLSVLSILAALVAAASSAATSADLILLWGAKAQAFAAARTIDASFLRDPSLVYMHPSYPPLVTNLQAFATQAAGRFAWGAATLTFPLLIAVLACSLPGALRLTASRRIAWAASALAVSALGFLGGELGVGGNADPWLWTFEALATAILIGPAARSGAGQLLAELLLAGTSAAKVEGLLFAAAAVTLFLMLRRREVRIGSAVAFLVIPSAVSLGSWFLFEATRHVFYGYEQYGRFLDVHWDRLSLVLSGIGHALWSAGWALPYLLPLAALLLAPARHRLLWLPVGVSLALCAFSVFTYLHGDPDPSGWISWSAGRIFSPVPVLLVIGAVGARPEQH